MIGIFEKVRVNHVFEAIADVNSYVWDQLFTLLLMGYTILLIIESFKYAETTRQFPLIVSVALIIVSILHLISQSRFMEGFGTSDFFSETMESVTDGMSDETEQRDMIRYRYEFEMIVWLCGLVILAWFFGFLVAGSAFVFAFVYAYRQSVQQAVVTAVAMYLFNYFLFIQFLNTALWQGVLP